MELGVDYKSTEKVLKIAFDSAVQKWSEWA